MSSNQNIEQEARLTGGEMEKAITEARLEGEMTARKEVGEWIESRLLGGPDDNSYSAVFPTMVSRLKQGKKL